LALLVLFCGCAAERDLITPVFTTPSPTDPLVAQRLAEKAQWHDDRIGRRHLTDEGLLAYQADALRDEAAGVRPTAYADMAIWTGVYLGAEALRSAVTSDPEAARRVARVVDGLAFLQEITQTPGLLARAVQPVDHPPDPLPDWRAGMERYRDYRWLGNVSVDQVLGVVFGYGLAFDLAADQERRGRIARRVSEIADHLHDHGMTIVDATGRRVKHGDLSPGFFSENLNALIALAIVKTAAHVSPDGPYQARYHDLIQRHGYDRRSAAARDRWWERLTGVNHSDNNLAMLAYDVLMRYEADERLRARYRTGLARTWRVTSREGNALFTYIAASGGVPVGADALADAQRALLDLPIDPRDVAVVNSTRADICIATRRDRTGDPQACAPLPIGERPAGPFEWNENPYRLDRPGVGRQAYTGLGYLLAYWVGRHRGFLSGPLGPSS
jgi:hypothetical protein